MDRIYNCLKEWGKPLLHITEFENLESILKEGGLLSLKESKRRGIKPKCITSESSRSIDEYRDTSDYVRLAYTPLYDMLPVKIYSGDLKNPVAILIDLEVLKTKSRMLFTTKNAVASDVKYYKQSEIGDYIDWRKVFSPRDKSTVKSIVHKDARQSEVMVPKIIESKYFTKIIVECKNNISDLTKYDIEIREAELKKIIVKYGQN